MPSFVRNKRSIAMLGLAVSLSAQAQQPMTLESFFNRMTDFVSHLAVGGYAPWLNHAHTAYLVPALTSNTQPTDHNVGFSLTGVHEHPQVEAGFNIPAILTATLHALTPVPNDVLSKRVMTSPTFNRPNTTQSATALSPLAKLPNKFFTQASDLGNTTLFQTYRRFLGYQLLLKQCTHDLDTSKKSSASVSKQFNHGSGQPPSTTNIQNPNQKPLVKPCTIKQAGVLLGNLKETANNLSLLIPSTDPQASLSQHYPQTYPNAAQALGKLNSRLETFDPHQSNPTKAILHHLCSQASRWVDTINAFLVQRARARIVSVLVDALEPSNPYIGYTLNDVLGPTTYNTTTHHVASTYLQRLNANFPSPDANTPVLHLGQQDIVDQGEVHSIEKSSASDHLSDIVNFRHALLPQIRASQHQYHNMLNSITALRGIGLATLHHLYNDRVAPKGSDLSQAGYAAQAATWRLSGQPVKLQFQVQQGKSTVNQQKTASSWTGQLLEASPVNVAREIALLLAEIRYQLYVNHLDQERVLANLAALQLTKAGDQARGLAELRRNLESQITHFQRGQ